MWDVRRRVNIPEVTGRYLHPIELVLNPGKCAVFCYLQLQLAILRKIASHSCDCLLHISTYTCSYQYCPILVAAAVSTHYRPA